MNENNELKGVLVTGASRGIGYELARLAAGDGYNPVLVSRTEEDLLKVKEKLEKEFGVQGKIIPGDLSEPGTPEKIFDEIESSNYRIDLLFNNAGRGQMGEFTKTDWETDREMMHLNMDAVIHLTKLFLPGMKERGDGGIINVSSLAAFQPGPLMALYYASKSFVQSFSEALAEEVKSYGIKVTALSPGPVDTDFRIKGKTPPEDQSDRSVSLDAEYVARIGYEGLKAGKRVVVPGKLASVVPQLTRFLPRKVVTRLVKKLNVYRLE
ncbi:SDR family oxidoreductase [Candidatus Bipolaricaulota bacterium]|nr:SDR family oxidoreductase [Candidatus Bipolaricaulota bacterium]